MIVYVGTGEKQTSAYTTKTVSDKLVVINGVAVAMDTTPSVNKYVVMDMVKYCLS